MLASSITLPLGVSAQTPTPAHRFNETNIQGHPLINIFDFELQDIPLGWTDSNGWGGTDHPVIIYTDTENVTISVWVAMPEFSDPLFPPVPVSGNTFSNGYLTSVSYAASWQNNRTVQVYTNTSMSRLDQVNFNLTSVPYGYQVIHVYATCVITPFDSVTASTYDIPQSSEKVLNFTVAAPPTPTPTPSMQNDSLPSTAPTIIIIIVVIVSAVIVFAALKRTKRRIDKKAIIDS